MDSLWTLVESAVDVAVAMQLFNCPIVHSSDFPEKDILVASPMTTNRAYASADIESHTDFPPYT